MLHYVNNWTYTYVYVQFVTLGVPSPIKRPEDVDMVIFRENTEDIYAGIEYASGQKKIKN